MGGARAKGWALEWFWYVNPSQAAPTNEIATTIIRCAGLRQQMLQGYWVTRRSAAGRPVAGAYRPSHNTFSPLFRYFLGGRSGLFSISLRRHQDADTAPTARKAFKSGRYYFTAPVSMHATASAGSSLA